MLKDDPRVTRKQLKRGDVEVWLGKQLRIIIERKRLSDLAQSIVDCRAHKIFLLKHASTAILLVEGRWVGKKRGAVPFDEMKRFCNAAILQGVHVKQTQDVKASAAEVLKLSQDLEWWEQQLEFMPELKALSEQNVPPSESVSQSESVSSSETVAQSLAEADVVQDVRKCLKSIPSLGYQTALVVSRHYGLEDIVRCEAVDLQFLKLPSGRTIGDVKAHSIVDYLKHNLDKFLCSIPFVTDKNVARVKQALLQGHDDLGLGPIRNARVRAIWSWQPPDPAAKRHKQQ